jgi:hypothetical protein
MGLELKLVAIDKPADVNLILGQTHFISARPRGTASSGRRGPTRR